MKEVILLSFMLMTLTFSVSHISAQYFGGSFMSHLTTPQRHLLEPLITPQITYYTEPKQRHSAPRPTQASSKPQSYIWSNLINPLNFNTPFDSYEPETEFVPLEAQQQHQQNQNADQHGRDNEEKPFEVDVVTSEVNGDNHQPGLFFQQTFPFFGTNLFNTFGGFGFGTQQEPWWKGPNVCTEKDEEEKVSEEDADKENEETDEGSNGAKQSNYQQFQFQLNSCVEKPNKHVCTRVVNKNGVKKTLTISRQCCHGYGRPRNAAYETPCEKIEIKDIEATATDMGAKEFVAKAKNSGLADTIETRKNVTIFLPLDEAFKQYTDSVQSENNLVEKKSEDDMKELYLRHVVDGEINLEDVRNEEVLKTQAEGQTIRINSYQIPLSLSPEPYRYTANCVPIEKHDKLSEQGMVHTLSGVLKPINNNVMDLIRKREDLSIMAQILDTTKLSELLEGEKPVTIFVPTDEAFKKLEPHLSRALKEGKGCALNILKNHILDLTFCSVASVPGAKTTAYNLLGEPMRFNRSKTVQAEPNAEQPVIINGIAKITEADIMGSNGVMHVIDTIMPTESALPLSSLMQEKNVTIFKRLLEATGLDNKFDDMDNATVFAPTNKALQNTEWARLLEEAPEQLKGNRQLIEFLNYHIAQPMIKTCDLQEQLMPTVSGDKVRINLYSTNALFPNLMNRATVNCARLVHFDDESCGSVLHQVDKPLQPAKQNLLDILESNPDYSKFLDLVRLANLTDLLANDEGDYTLLIPKNEVFVEVENSLPKDQVKLENLIKTHIVDDVVCCAGIIPSNWPSVRTIESLNGYHLRISRDHRPKIQNAGITKCDTIATNGIIHEINDIIVLSSRQQQRQPQAAPKPHIIQYPGQQVQRPQYPFQLPEDFFGGIFD